VLDDIQFEDQPDDLDFSLESLASLNLQYKEINPLRWSRIRNGVVEFSDIVEELTGKRGSMIRCPFHGRDSTASFALYPVSRGNCGYCFGCPPGKQTWDAFRFVKEILDLPNRFEALRWIEKTYDLEPLADLALEEEETLSLTISDLSEYYIQKVQKEQDRDVDLILDYIRIYFLASRKDEPLLLARVLGKDVLRRVFQDKEKIINV
jgi:hypothetical protein